MSLKQQIEALDQALGECTPEVRKDTQDLLVGIFRMAMGKSKHGDPPDGLMDAVMDVVQDIMYRVKVKEVPPDVVRAEALEAVQGCNHLVDIANEIIGST
jgi:hypothetical protein